MPITATIPHATRTPPMISGAVLPRMSPIPPMITPITSRIAGCSSRPAIFNMCRPPTSAIFTLRCKVLSHIQLCIVKYFALPTQRDSLPRMQPLADHDSLSIRDAEARLRYLGTVREQVHRRTLTPGVSAALLGAVIATHAVLSAAGQIGGASC